MIRVVPNRVLADRPEELQEKKTIKTMFKAKNLILSYVFIVPFTDNFANFVDKHVFFAREFIDDGHHFDECRMITLSCKTKCDHFQVAI